MAKKKSNKKAGKNSGSPKTTGGKTIKKEVENISQENIEKIEKFDKEEIPEEVNNVPEEEIKETREDEQKIEEIKTTGNVDKYINFLRDKLKRIKAIESKTEEIQKEQEQIKTNLSKEKSEFDTSKAKERAEFEEEKKAFKAELEKDRKDLNDRRKKIDEEKYAIDNGEYTYVIQSLLDTLRKTEEEITDSTKSLVEKLGEKHGALIKDIEDLYRQKEELDKEKIEVESEKSKVALEKKRNELNKQSYERRIKEDLKDEYEDDLIEKEEQIRSLKKKNAALEKELEEISSFKRELSSTFVSTSAEEMIKEQTSLKNRCAELENQLEQRPSQSDYETKVKAIESLQEKIQELENKVNEERLSELRLSLQNADTYIYEINTYKALKDSAEAREKSLQRTVNDLHETINRLKDEERIKEGAFEQAKQMDNNPELQNRKFREKSPESLKDVVEYIQWYMTTEIDPEPFYYEQKVIRTFLAGLYMSPLTILQGPSGTGKTRLPIQIAKALVAGADKEYRDRDDVGNRNEPFRTCAIQSGWRDNMDLIGFYNNFEKKYKETDFFKALYLAAQPKYKDTLFFVILDEMNLSHPEHYFADFLSLMEQSVDDRYVKIQADEELLPKLIKERQMKLPPNIRFIGTANHDETTLDFAPKTYDRSNVMIMDDHEKEEIKKEVKAVNNKYSISYSWLMSRFEEAENEFKNNPEDGYSKIREFLKHKGLHKELKDRGIGIGNRFDKQARKFVCAYWALDGKSPKSIAEAADHLISSRLFRTLKNRYDLSKENLENFRDYYLKVFNEKFESDPVEGLKLLNHEIKNKE